MSDIIRETILLAKSSDLTVRQICAAANIKTRWYHKFIAGEFKDPGVSKVLRLNAALKKKKRAA